VTTTGRENRGARWMPNIAGGRVTMTSSGYFGRNMKPIITDSDNPGGAVRLSSATWLSRLRAASGYEMGVRVLGGSWFLLLALASASKVVARAHAMTIADFSPTGWPALLSSTCLFLFYLMLFWLILHRGQPAARTAGILPSLTAFAGTYLPWTIGLSAPGTASATQDIASAVLVLIGAVSMLAVVFHLGRCFSIVPQARGLVRTGPYAVVRHPLYLVEEIALLGMLVGFFSPLTLAMFLAQGAIQVRRIFYEEALLRRTFPDFDDYARSTSRLIPHVW
jgi:protein-S-isoprenylcysteine O-methyltransferase Ste14